MQKVKNSDRALEWRAALVIFVLEAAVGVYLGYFKGVLLGDAVSRTANAFYVLFLEPHRFASMGLVWNPLPSTLQLPFVALAKLWRPFVSRGVGAAILSALFAAWESKILLHIFLECKVGRRYALLAVALFSFHPYIFFYGANGMSENISFAFSIYIICSMTLWMKRGDSKYLIQIAVGFVGLFFTRYESVPFAAAIGVCLIVYILFSKREQQYILGQKKSERYFYIEGTMLLVFLPLGYAGLLWVFYNWVISGNPFYFLNSGYSMLAYSAYYSDYGDPLHVLSFLWARTWPFLLLLGGVVVLRVLTKRVWKADMLIFLGSSLVLTVFQYLMLMRGSSAGYVRYMCYPLPICMAWLPYELSELQGRWLKWGKRLFAGLLAASALWFCWAFQYSEIIREDTLLMLPEGSTRMAEYINVHLQDETLLTDAYRAYYILLNLDDLSNVVTSSNDAFEEDLADPVRRGVDYILVPESGSYGDMDAVNIAYRDLYYHGADWCVEEASFGEFKLFRVLN